jgi:3-methyladenine DNA glycosylase AlkD
MNVIDWIKSNKNEDNIKGMARFGINPENTYGVSIPKLRAKAKEIGKDHSLALELWGSGIHEARILAAFIDDPKLVTESQMESWVKDIDSWDVCDQVCGFLFDKTPYAYDKALEWSKRDEEFVKRAGFALMAWLSIHDKKAPDEKFIPFFAAIKEGARDERNFVKKAVNWALRQTGKKRGKDIYKLAIKTAEELEKSESKSARWIAKDALRELKSEKVQKRLCKP